MNPQNKIDFSEVIAEEFGPNASYVQGLLDRFRSNPQLVDDSWRAYFTELMGDATSAKQSGNGKPAVATLADGNLNTKPAPAAAIAPAIEKKPATTPAVDGNFEVLPIRGPALKIVENMETSLSVPTATSERRIPVKLLDENRRIINKHLAENDRGKASYTHLIAWAVLRALDQFPQLNDGFTEAEGNPARAKRTAVNLGVAIDVTKKDGSRSLLVPNIKNANTLTFSQLPAAFLEVGDVLAVRNPDLSLGQYVLQAFDMPLGTGGPMACKLLSSKIIIADGG